MEVVSGGLFLRSIVYARHGRVLRGESPLRSVAPYNR